jgi:glycosyltransferase involved in cell wall biosynthesis
MNNQKGISILICCYNSTSRLKPTLEHISKQQVDINIPWEVIVIDNNSSDGTGEYAIKIWQNLNCLIPFQVVDELISGLSNARKKGITTSKYEYILFCDDDNWLAPNYVNIAFNIMEKDKTIGLAGGWSTATSEIDLPPWFTQSPMFFAVGKQYKKTGIAENYLYGAGLILRYTCFRELTEKSFSFLLSDRKGNTLSSGGDVELCYAIQLLGYKLWYDEDLYFQHFMPSDRLTMKHYIKLRKGISKSDVILSAYKAVLNKHKKISIFNRFQIFIKFLIKIPFICFQYLFGDKTKAIINYYHYHYTLQYYAEYNEAWKKIQAWKKMIP